MGHMQFSILVAEDDTGLRRLLLKLLHECGYTAVGAADGSEAMRLLSNCYYDLIVSDIVMAPMDGLALTLRAKASAPGTKVLLMTAYGEKHTAGRARASGADGYISKPFAMRHLLATVQTLLGERAGGKVSKQSSTPSERSQP